MKLLFILVILLYIKYVKIAHAKRYKVGGQKNLGFFSCEEKTKTNCQIGISIQFSGSSSGYTYLSWGWYNSVGRGVLLIRDMDQLGKVYIPVEELRGACATLL